VAATGFFTVEVCTLRGLVTHHVLFFLDLASRAVKIGGITIHPNDLWMSQVARNLTDAGDQFFHRTRFLIMDRDAKYSDAFRNILTREGLEIIRLPPCREFVRQHPGMRGCIPVQIGAWRCAKARRPAW
jgi:hypothetical protein